MDYCSVNCNVEWTSQLTLELGHPSDKRTGTILYKWIIGELNYRRPVGRHCRLWMTTSRVYCLTTIRDKFKPSINAITQEALWTRIHQPLLRMRLPVPSLLAVPSYEHKLPRWSYEHESTSRLYEQKLPRRPYEHELTSSPWGIRLPTPPAHSLFTISTT